MAAPPPTQATQAGLLAAIQPSVDAAFAELELNQLEQSIPNLTQAVQAIVTRYGRASAAIATVDYLARRREAGIRSSYTVAHAELPNLDQIEASVKWTTRSLWYEEPNLASVRSNVGGVVDRLVLGVGRQTTVENVQKDSGARGWAREVRPQSCSFCLLLATRGAVYKEDSFARANAKFVGEGQFKFHDHCHCIAVPVFGVYEPTAEVRRAQQIYKESTRGVKGARNMRRAFRRAVESGGDTGAQEAP